MASGFVTAASLDLDSVFAPQHSGWPQAGATEFFDGSGNDLNLRYAALSTGSAASATKFILSSGADLNTLFAAYGSTGVQVATQPSGVSGSAAAGNPSGTVTSNTTTCAGAKGGGSYTYAWHIANGSGFTFTSPNSPTTATTGDVPAGQSVSGGIYCTISDGVTSINTNTVTASLQNTTPAFSGQTDTYSAGGTYTDTVPAGARTMVVETWGESGRGGSWYNGGGANFAGGGGGGSGGYSRSQYDVSSSNGHTMSVTVAFAASGNATTVQSGGGNPISGFTAMSSPGGGNGGNAVNANVGGAAGTAGSSASGGNQANSAGNAGTAGEGDVQGGSPGIGGSGIAGVNGTGNAGGGGQTSGIAAGSGGDGLVIIKYTP